MIKTRFTILALFFISSIVIADETRLGTEVEVDAVKDAMYETLKDNESARIKNLRFKMVDGTEYFCGLVNSKNSYGGYGGFEPFIGFTFEEINKQKGYVPSGYGAAAGRLCSVNGL